MSDCEKMVDYIEHSNVPQLERSGMTWVELLALMYDLPWPEALELAFRYGRAKGYRLAQQEAGQECEKRVLFSPK